MTLGQFVQRRYDFGTIFPHVVTYAAERLQRGGPGPSKGPAARTYPGIRIFLRIFELGLCQDTQNVGMYLGSQDTQNLGMYPGSLLPERPKLSGRKCQSVSGHPGRNTYPDQDRLSGSGYNPPVRKCRHPTVT